MAGDWRYKSCLITSKVGHHHWAICQPETTTMEQLPTSIPLTDITSKKKRTVDLEAQVMKNPIREDFKQPGAELIQAQDS